MCLEQPPKAGKWKAEEESGPSRLHYGRNRPEYLKESWKYVKTCCHSDFSKKKKKNSTEGENSQGVVVTVIIIIIFF